MLPSELAGTRTQGPYIKSVLLYQLSYQFNNIIVIWSAKIKNYHISAKQFLYKTKINLHLYLVTFITTLCYKALHAFGAINFYCIFFLNKIFIALVALYLCLVLVLYNTLNNTTWLQKNIQCNIIILQIK